MKDRLFLDPGRRRTAFAFDDTVAAVFDDMLRRSIPFYFEIQNMIADVAGRFVQARGKIFDLGCSTGTTIALLEKRLSDKAIEFTGVDSSEPMLQRAKKNLSECGVRNYRLIECDLNQGVEIEQADVAIMNLVLQFVRPENRKQLLSEIFSGLNEDGCLILVEKTVSENENIDQIFNDSYLEFKKRNLYTSEEIAAKRKSLENILVPYSLQQNRQQLEDAGFKTVEVFFRWFNFCGLLALKNN